MAEGMIKFGTSGWRGIISDDFTFENVKRVSQAIADYCLNKGGEVVTNGVIVGYDTRFMSEKFAAVVAEVLSNNGIKALLTDRDTPTPVISWEIIERKLAGGVNITASHNPPDYNGIKFSPSWGGPALPDTTKIIEDYANNPNLKIKTGGGGIIEQIDCRSEYLKDIRKKVDMKLIKKAGLKAGVDCLFGTGRGYIDSLLKECCKKVVVFHDFRDAMFGGSSPEPSPAKLTDLKAAIKKEKLAIGLSVDGDADRFGIMDSDGTFITPNEVLTLLLSYLKKSRGWEGCVVRTVATTHFVDAVAKKYGIPVRETPVGFKYIGEIMLKEPMIIGGEESGGLTIQGHIPEKDGILACMLMLEMVAAEKKSIRQILKGLYKEVGFVATGRINIKLEDAGKKRLIELMKTNPPKTFGAYKVTGMNTMDGFKFLLEGNSWIMIRLSGTEPLVRCYTESDSTEKQKELEILGDKFVKSV